MGGGQSKTPPPDMNTVIFKLKMSAKRFFRESQRAAKDKEKNLANAKACLVKGNEEGARLYAANAQNNLNESKKYLMMGTRLDAITGQIKSNHNFTGVMKSISKEAVPMMMMEADKLDIKTLCVNFDNFNEAFDKMTVNTNIMGGTFDRMNDAGTVQNTENLLNDLKREVNYELGKEANLPQGTKMLEVKPAQTELDDFIANLKSK